MNYYTSIKNELINNEVYKSVKDYSKNRSDLKTYYNVGKLLSEAGKHYGEGIIKEYSRKLTIEVGKKYSTRLLYKMLKFYNFLLDEKVPTLSAKLSWSHYEELLPLKDINEINYYIDITEKNNLGVRALREKIKNKEYERLSTETKEKLKNGDKLEIGNTIKNEIIIYSNKELNSEDISEKALQNIILEDIDLFLEQLGEGYCYIKSEYKIMIGSRPNYIDLLLFNIKFKCYVVVELKVTELKKEHIGQIEVYMNYINENVKDINHNKTIGIIICKKDNKYIMHYINNNNIYRSTYLIK